MIYTVKNMVVENNQIVYNDGSTKIFLYTKGTKGGSKELKDLLTYFENTTLTNAVDSDLQEIQKIVDSVKADFKERERYMTYEEVLYYEKRDSHEAGIIEGIIYTHKSLNSTPEQAKAALIKQFNLTEEKADEYIHLYWQ